MTDLAVLYALHVPRMRGWLYRRGLSHESAEDVVQNVFVRVLAHPEYTVTPTLLYRVALSAAADFGRFERRRSHQTLTEDIAGDTDPADAVNDLDTLLAQLPPRHARVLHLRFVRDLSLRDAAQVLGLNLPSVKALQKRALFSAKKVLQEEGTK